jgi:GTP-binding protein Era
MRDVDVLTLVVDVSVKEGAGDRYLVGLLRGVKVPVILALNKVDLIAKAKLLPLIERYGQAHPFVEFVPISAADGTNVDVLEGLFRKYLPDGEPLYPPDYVTDQPDRFFVTEIIREQVLELTHAELPFSTAVVIDRYGEPDADKVVTMYCSILVERESQKPIVIGKGGAMIKQIGTAARIELERFLDARVYLDLHVKVKSEWRNNDRVLDEMGLRDRARS